MDAAGTQPTTDAVDIPVAVRVLVGKAVGEEEGVGDGVGDGVGSSAVAVALAGNDSGVCEGIIWVGVLLGSFGFTIAVAVGVFTDCASTTLMGVCVGAKTRADNFVRSFSMAGLPGPAKKSHPKIPRLNIITRLMTRAGVNIERRSRNSERSGIA